ncbi:hypothetical protein WOLCODRAFT_84700, partial [Wolfiporia cocos MD-104 SS10]
LLGMYFNWALLGLLNHQVYIYYERFPRDKLALKCLVCGILILEWVQTGMFTAAEMTNFVYDFGHPLQLYEVNSSWFSGSIMTGIISATAQIFYAWRIYKLSDSRILSGVICIVSDLLCNINAS